MSTIDEQDLVLLTEWAQGGIDKCTAQARESEEVRICGKKLHWHTTFGEIAVEEPLWRRGTREPGPSANGRG